MIAGGQQCYGGRPDYVPVLSPHLVVSQGERRPVVCSPQSLRLHKALGDAHFVDVVGELNETASLKELSTAEPILITASSTILAGFGHWRLALAQGTHEVHCIEIPISEEESLRFILNHHKPRPGWNAFVRIRAALTEEPCLQQRALENMRAGGRYKGWANLPEARHINVRQQIADDAGVGTRNVSNVKTILKTAHPRLIAALMNGTLSINCAMQFCKLSQAEQLECLVRHAENREISKVIRRSVTRRKTKRTGVSVATILDVLQQQEACRPGSVVVRLSRCQHTVILVGQDLLTKSHSHEELKKT